MLAESREVLFDSQVQTTLVETTIMLGFTEFYQRNLPHWQPPGAILFITFRTAGSLPRAVEDKLRCDARLFKENYKHLPYDAPELMIVWKKLFKFADANLDQGKDACFLRSPAASAIVCESIRRGQELQHYILHRYCVMPNHVHLVIEPLPDNAPSELSTMSGPQWPPMFYKDEGRAMLTTHAEAEKLVWRPIGTILKALIGSTSRQITQALNISAPIWMTESYDHWLRNGGEYERLLAYVDNNPVKAGLCKRPEDWKWGSAGTLVIKKD